MDTAKKTAVWLIIAFVVFFIIEQPQELANIITGTVHLLHRGANSVTELIKDL
jgi:hypothetical protein